MSDYEPKDDMAEKLAESLEVVRVLPRPLALEELRRRREREHQAKLAEVVAEAERINDHARAMVYAEDAEAWCDRLRALEMKFPRDSALRVELEEARDLVWLATGRLVRAARREMEG